MSRKQRPSKTGLEVSQEEAANRLRQLIDDTTNKKANTEQTSYIFGVKCFLYTSGQDDLLRYPQAASRWPCSPSDICGTCRLQAEGEDRAAAAHEGRRRHVQQVS